MAYPKSKSKDLKSPIIYQGKSGEIKFRGDFDRETIWGTQKQIADLFSADRSVVTKHINNVFKSGEVSPKSNVQKIHIANSDKPVKFYSLDIILAVGYRTNSSRAIEFRKWATKTLRQHIIEGYTINRKRVAQNYTSFMQAVAEVKALLPEGNQVQAKDVLELINAFASTWFSLEEYDNQKFPQKGATKKEVVFTAEELKKFLQDFKEKLIEKKQATSIFGQERTPNNMSGIVGNIFQTFDNQDLYPTVEEKAANLLYFIVKDHPYIDGNKRSGAFAFVWFLRYAEILPAGLTPEALTALTLLVAESNPHDKEKMIGVILLILR